MVMQWGVLYETFPLSNGGPEGVCVDFKKTSSSRRSFRAYFFNRLKQLRPRQVLVAGRSVYSHG